MAHVERTLTTSTDIHTVWDYLTDFTTTEEWDPPTVSTTRTSGDGGVGTTYHDVSKLLGSESEVDHVVSAVEPLLPPGLKILGDRVADRMQECLDGLGTTTTADGSGLRP